MQSDNQEQPSSGSTEPIFEVNRGRKNFIVEFKNYSWPRKILTIFLIYILASVVIGFAFPSSTKVDTFLASEKKISEINGRWQIEARKLTSLIGAITNGSVSDPVQIQTDVNDVRGRISPILTELADECRKLPERDSEATGQAAAEDGAFEMLREWCRITPAQTLELYQVINAQISYGASQADIDTHITNYQNLQRDKLQAINSGLSGLLPYVSGTDKSSAETLLSAVRSQLNS